MTQWKYYHLLSPSFHHSHIWFYCEQFIPVSSQNFLLKLFNHIIHFNYVLADFPVSVNGVSATFMQFIIVWFGDSIICFVRIYLWPFHCYTKSSLCVGDLVKHHTPHLRVTHIRWPVPYKGLLSSCITWWSKMDGWERMAAVQHILNLITSGL